MAARSCELRGFDILGVAAVWPADVRADDGKTLPPALDLVDVPVTGLVRDG